MAVSERYERAYLRESYKWTMAFGICLAIVGVIATAVPLVFANLSARVIGFFLILSGGLRGVDVIRSGGKTATFARTLSSVLYVLVGAMIVISPLDAVFGLALVIAVLFCAEGFSYLLVAAIAFPIPGWYWGVIHGGLTMALATLILLGWPASAPWAIGVLVGANLLVGGLSIIGVARKARDVLARDMPSIATMDGS